MRSIGFAWWPQTVSQVELGRQAVSACEILGLAAVMDVPVGCLMDVADSQLRAASAKAVADERERCDAPPAVIEAAAAAITRCLMSGEHDFSTWMDSDDHLARIALAAAAPLIAAAERELIRQELTTVVIDNAGDSDALLAALLVAIRELMPRARPPES
jgi:hypothetical protein